jgi:hypothetical protein
MLGLAVVLHFCFWYFPHPRSMTYAANDNTQSNLSKQTATLHPIQSLSQWFLFRTRGPTASSPAGIMIIRLILRGHNYV